MSEVVLQHICKTWNNVVGVQDFCLDIADGEFLVLVGPSGCGKSTTLRMIAGLETPTSGNILINGRDVTDLEPKDRDIAMVFQSYALYPHKNVFDNMAFGLLLRGEDKEVIRTKVEEVAQMLGITALLRRHPKELSGGQRQRVALGRAIVRSPSVFLMDEPLSNLDAKLRVVMRSELIKLHQRLASTFIYVTHDQTEAMTMGTRIVVMKDGVIQQIGTPSDIYDRPCNRFVAGFIGSPPMNFLEGELVRRDGVLCFRSRPLRTEVPPFPGLEKYEGRKIVLGIRPEHLSLAPEAEEKPFTCEVVEHVGSSYIIHATHADHGEVVMLLSSRSTPPAPGDALALTCEKDCVHLFDAESEASLRA